MLWKTLYDRIGKQPLSYTQHNHIAVVYEGKRIPLDLKYDAKGHPYLVPMANPPKKECYNP